MHENISVNNDIRDRVGFLIQEKSMSVQAFADSVNSHRGTIYDIIGGRRNKPSSDLLANIVSVYTDISASWLLAGIGEPFLKPETAQEKLEREFKQHLKDNPIVPAPPKPESPNQARNRERKLQKAIEANEPLAAYNNVVSLRVPEKPNVIPLNVRAAAGGNACIIETDTQVTGEALSFPGVMGTNIKYAIQVYGDSMQPTLASGDVIVIEAVENRKPGRIYAVASKDNIAYIKRFREETDTHLLFESDNMDYEPLTLLKSEIHQCFEVLAKYSTNLNLSNVGSSSQTVSTDWQRRIVRLEQDTQLLKTAHIR